MLVQVLWLERLLYCFPKWLCHFTFPLVMYESSNFSIFLLLSDFSIPAILVHVIWYLIVVVPNDRLCQASFHVIIGHLYKKLFSRYMICKSFLPFCGLSSVSQYCLSKHEIFNFDPVQSMFSMLLVLFCHI